jgi:hypothetical protein
MKKAGMEYQMGGSKMKNSPDASKYVGNPMGYYADKAAYGREMARQEMMQNGGAYEFETGNAADGKITKKKKTYDLSTGNAADGKITKKRK